MGSPKHGRVLEASRPALRARNRQFYGEGRVLGSHRDLPQFKLRQVSEDPKWDVPGTEQSPPRSRTHASVIVIPQKNGPRTSLSKKRAL